MVVERFSTTVAKIELYYQNSDLTLGATGTAFFYKSNEDIFLITNWHNVTGINALTSEAMHSKGLLPNMIRVHYKQWADETKNQIRSQPIDIPLYSENVPIWFEHSLRNGVDVVAIPLAISDFVGFANECINTISQEPALEVRVGMDCFILGYPENLSLGVANTPIWKRGSIASEPYEQQPYFIDSATRTGMSGSPVIARHTGIFGMKGSQLTGTEQIGTVSRFIAIYSWRVGNDALGFQLGSAWPSSVLDDILSKKLPGKHPNNWNGT